MHKRPLRIGDHVPLGKVEPPVMRAGEVGTWHLEVEIACSVRGGSCLELVSGQQRWIKLNMSAQSWAPTEPNFVSARLQNGQRFEPVKPDSSAPGPYQAAFRYARRTRGWHGLALCGSLGRIRRYRLRATTYIGD